ncbi:2-dehydropantoate 2-reductase [Leptothrix cholodnii SP-6]|uniref:2-dehydropantoate 2-reductase n=1 Tax=Leptothrix cholodnii (strain ATCC 51168 / LMG 8142 / SP-6) TaxID=395495 RepID=B1Y6V0_LEPCP|nr:2-dehydropantoate 2-reductase [Leptothrix cholodnii]ACB32428.1 2-dehydropantoate 2-reductase [Leptothrix cholodnii SP-6]
MTHALVEPARVSADEPDAQVRVAVVGVGAIGGVFAGWLGSRLPAGRIRLSALARGDTLRALQAQGLVLQEAAGPVHVPLHASDDPAALGPQDLVILAVKGPALAAVAPAVRALLAPHTTVLVAMNGVPWWFFDGLPGSCEGLALDTVDPGGVIAAAIPGRHVLGCVVHVSASAPGPGEVANVRHNSLIIGEPAGGLSPRVDATAALLAEAGFAVTRSERIQHDIWFKLWGNMTMNPVSALTGVTCDRILDDPLVRAFCSAVMTEAQAIGRHIGCDIDQQPDDRHAITRGLGAFKTSMLQDLEAGRALEIDGLVGAVREIGQHLGLHTPHTDALLGLVRLMAQGRGLYPVRT